MPLPAPGGSSGHHAHPGSAARVVLGIVSLPVPCDSRVHSGPLLPVEGSFYITRQAGSGPFVPRAVGGAAGNLAHAPADLDGVGRYDRAFRLAVGDDVVKDHRAVAAVGEVEGTQVDPGPSTHFLVDEELRLTVAVTHGVVRGVRAVAKRLVRHIYGIGAGLRDAETPCSFSFLSFLFGVCETFARGDPPAPLIVFALAPEHALALAPEGRVVVGDDLIGLDIALARSHDIGSGILQHGYQEGQDIALRVHVLNRGEERRPLPGPSSPAFVVVAAVALPHGDMALAKAFRVILLPDTRDERPYLFPSVGIAVYIRRGPPPVPTRRGNKVLDRILLAVDASNGTIRILRGHKVIDLVLEPVQSGLCPRVVAELLAELEVQ